jgi:O-antigen/teichoic acid export membrane protein
MSKVSNNELAALSKAQRLLASPAASMLMYGLALFTMKGLSLLMLPIITRFLDPETMGQLEIIAVSTSFLGLLLSVSLHEALYRFVPQLDTHRQKSSAAQLFWLTVSISTIVAIGLTIGIQIYSVSLYGLSDTILTLAALSLSIEGGLAVGLAWLRMQDRTLAFCSICIGGSLLQVSLVLLALSNHWGVIGILVAGVVAHSVQFIVLNVMVRFPLSLPSRHQAMQYLKYCIPMMLSGLCAFGLNGAERFFIVQNSGLVVLGHFAIAAKFSLAMCVLVQPFGMWWMPKRFTLLKQDPIKACTITQIGCYLVCALAVTVSIIGQWGLNVILPSSYAPASAILTGAIFMVVGKEFAELLNLSLLAKKQTGKLLVINAIITTITLFFCAFFASHGVWAIMITIGVGQMLRALTLLVYGRTVYPLPYDYRALFLAMSVTIATLGVIAANPNSLTSLIIASLCLICIGVIAYRSQLSIRSKPSANSLLTGYKPSRRRFLMPNKVRF